MATIRVLRLGDRFDLPDLDEGDTPPDMEWYGTVEVQIDNRVHWVGAVLGVHESDRESVRASGAGERPYLDAWYADASDWQDADPPVPQPLARPVINAIASEVERLWTEAEQERNA